MAGAPAPRGKYPELKDKVITPGVLLQPHVASLEMTYYEGQQFPAEYRGSIFAALHGSWNRAHGHHGNLDGRAASSQAA